MSCYRPKKGFPVGLTETGKTKYKIVPYETDHLEQNGEKWEAVTFPVPAKWLRPVKTDWIQIPCGKCIGCRLDYARGWTMRLMAEKQDWPDELCWFLTLTYDDEHLPVVLGADSFGEAKLWPTLRPRDLTLFWKSLRKQFAVVGLKYFAAAEYGSKTGRPHYHAIVFGLPLDLDRLDHLTPYSRNDMGDTVYRSAKLERIWKNGRVMVGKVTDKSCGYVARYCLKKLYDQSIDDFSNREHEFTRMSRNPGIGANWSYQNVVDLALFSLPSAPGQKFTLPRYFMERLRKDDPDKWQEIHDRRFASALASFDNMMHDEQRPYLEVLKAKELYKKQKISGLFRKL